MSIKKCIVPAILIPIVLSVYRAFRCTSDGWAQFWVQLAYTYTTIFLLFAAVWGEQIRSWWRHARFEVVPNEPIGLSLNRGNGQKTWYCHLRVRNQVKKTEGRVRVCCTGIERQAKDSSSSSWTPEQFPDRLPFCWCYSDVYGYEQRIIGDVACIDLAHVDQGSEKLQLVLGICPNNVNRSLTKNERLKAHLGVELDGCLQEQRFSFVIEWKGEWSDDSSQMNTYDQIKPVHEWTVTRERWTLVMC